MRLAQLTPFLPAVLWAGAIWIVGGLSIVPGAPALEGGLDKLGHFTGYAVLGLLLGRGWAAGGGRALAVALVVGALTFGAADELRQSLVPGRSADPMDWLADAAGILTGFLLAVLYRARQRRRA